MHCLNYRIGILFRENQHKKSYEMRYFFIDDGGNLFYLSSLARLQKIIRLSSDFEDIKIKLTKMGEKCLSLAKYNINPPRHYQSEAILPFSNRTCIDIRERQGKDERGYQLFGLIDEDTPLLHEEILRLTGRKKDERSFQIFGNNEDQSPLREEMNLAGRKKADASKRKSVLEDEKNKQEIRTLQFVNNFLMNQEGRFKMEHVGQENSEVQFQGEGVASEANGKGVETLIKQGLSYTGYFRNGKKHGAGLLVSETLDSLTCQFIDDQLSGI